MIMNFFSKINVTVLLILSAMSVIAGDFFAKYWSGNARPTFYILAMVGYLFSAIFYIPTLLREGLVITSIIWSVISTIGFLVIGIGIFKESLNAIQIIGVILGAASLTLLAYGGN